MTTQSTSDGTVMVDKEDFRRLEEKVDRLVEGFNRLAVVEERQSSNNSRVQELEKQVAAQRALHEVLDKTVNKWINRGVGVWGVVGALWTLITYLHK